jgi:hypothetical protein
VAAFDGCVVSRVLSPYVEVGSALFSNSSVFGLAALSIANVEPENPEQLSAIPFQDAFAFLLYSSLRYRYETVRPHTVRYTGQEIDQSID